MKILLTFLLVFTLASASVEIYKNEYKDINLIKLSYLNFKKLKYLSGIKNQ